MKTARFVKSFDMSPLPGAREAKLYSTDLGFVRASAVDCPGLGLLETYLFHADERGVVTDWSEMEGSVKGYADCDRAMREAGYEVLP
jgi:hypothetical protein